MQQFINVNSYDPAYFGSGTKLTVLEQGRTPVKPTVEILKPSEHECRNNKDKKRKKTLVCVGSGFYPDHVSVSWESDREAITKGVATDEAAQQVGKDYRITSRLRVSAKDWYTEGKAFTCIVSFFDGTETTNENATIHGVKGVSDGGITREKYLNIANQAKLSYCVFIVKSCIYGAFVGYLVWKLQSSSGKRKH